VKIKTVAMILALSLGVVANAQDKTSCPEKVTYDRFEDKTTEVCAGFVSHKEGFKLFGMHPIIEYKGEKRQAPFFISFVLMATDAQLQGLPKLRFDDVKLMFVLADTGRVELPVTDYKQSGNELQHGHFVVETATIHLSQAAINYLLTAKTVEGRLGVEEFRFNPGGLRAFQDYLKTILPPLPSKPAPPVRRRRP
jgi:hypothetical protein